MKKMKWIAMLLGMIMLSIALPVIAAASEPTTEAPPVEPVISSKKLTLYKGQKKRLKVTGTDETIRWTSSKKTVATVTRKGLVKALRSGKTVITAKFGDEKLTCRVTVKLPSIKLNKKNIKVDPYTTKTLKATVVGPSEDVTWKTSNKKIAAVSSNGTVTGINPGTAVISATANKMTAQCVVTVNSPGSLYLDQTELYLVPGEKDFLEATLVGSAGKSTYTWSSSNTAVVSLDPDAEDCVVTAGKAGTATVTVKYGSLKATCKITVVGSKTVTHAEVRVSYSGGRETDFLYGYDSSNNVRYMKEVASGPAAEGYLAISATFQNYVYVVTPNNVQVRNLQTGELSEIAPIYNLSIGGSPIACVDKNGYLYCVSSYMGSPHIVYKISPYTSHKLSVLWSSYLYSNFQEPYNLSVSGSYLTVYDSGPYYSRAKININYGTVSYYK